MLFLSIAFAELPCRQHDAATPLLCFAHLLSFAAFARFLFSLTQEDRERFSRHAVMPDEIQRCLFLHTPVRHGLSPPAHATIPSVLRCLFDDEHQRASNASVTFMLADVDVLWADRSERRAWRPDAEMFERRLRASASVYRYARRTLRCCAQCEFAQRLPYTPGNDDMLRHSASPRSRGAQKPRSARRGRRRLPSLPAQRCSMVCRTPRAAPSAPLTRTAIYGGACGAYAHRCDAQAAADTDDSRRSRAMTCRHTHRLVCYFTKEQTRRYLRDAKMRQRSLTAAFGVDAARWRGALLNMPPPQALLHAHQPIPSFSQNAAA